MRILGIDIGSNSVGSAWVDTETHQITVGASVFPAGVEESDEKRGAPKNQARRNSRSQRRSIARRAQRKHQMRTFLLDKGWMPTNSDSQKGWFDRLNPWLLRKEGLWRPLSELEFGRVLLHLVQRRGASWMQETDPDEDQGQREDDDQKVKAAITHAKQEMKNRCSPTFGAMMADLYIERRRLITNKKGQQKDIGSRIRNRSDSLGQPVYEFAADRELIRQEFDALWTAQKSFDSPLAVQLTDDCRKILEDDSEKTTWRTCGILFGQRRTFWDTGTLGRCDLEPTDRCCPKPDMYAQEFLVLETVNNIRIAGPGETPRPLTDDERTAVFHELNTYTTKAATPTTIRKALKIDRGEKKTLYWLNIEKDDQRQINSNWFYRQIVLPVFGSEAWGAFPQSQKDSLNNAILKFDPKSKAHEDRLRQGGQTWWSLSGEQTEKLIERWKTRGKVDDRINLSRRAVKNLLPYMKEHKCTVTEARKYFAEDATNQATPEQRARYALSGQGVVANRAMRHFLSKHPDLLPPAPVTSNPVVRKAIHAVREHVIGYLRKFGKPDRIIIELAREGRQTAKIRNRQLSENRDRERKRKEIIEKYRLQASSKNQRERAILRVLLCRQQNTTSAYSDRTITEDMAAIGDNLEIDHIVPKSRGGMNGQNNRLLCFAAENRGKGNQTPKEWMTDSEYQAMERRFDYFKKQNPVKWELLHREVKDREEFVQSALTDTAYASQQVTAWLQEVLYGNQNDGTRRIFTTKGAYTAILRRDWGLFYDQEDSGTSEKNRSDHRHHAVDAVVIALSGPERIQDLAHRWEQREIARAEGTYLDDGELPPPWDTKDRFRAAVIDTVKNLTVSHRPVGRKLGGMLHRATQYGPVDPQKNLYTSRIYVSDLSANHLKVPQGWDHLREKLDNATTKAEKRVIRRLMLALQDVPPGKPGIVRDRWLREEIRAWLRSQGLNPNTFSDREMKQLLKGDKGHLPKEVILGSGVPVQRVKLLRVFKRMFQCPRKFWNDKTGRLEVDPSPKSLRAYESRNNHHIEIRVNKKGEWSGKVVPNWQAVERVRKPLTEKKNRPGSAVDRSDMVDGKLVGPFVMSLSIGEMVYMKQARKNEPEYFVVFKIDQPEIVWFTPHYDAGRSKDSYRCRAREEIKVRVPNLRSLGCEDGTPPQKVWVGPLGQTKVLLKD